MRVSVQTDSGAVFPLEIGADETVEIIKKRLQSLLLLSSQHEGQEEEEENDDVEQNQTDHADGVVTMIEDMELSLGGRALENRRTLKDYSIVPDAALHLAISRGQDQNLPPADGVVASAFPQQATSLGTLSALPPEMLTHIMSFVPFEDLIVKVACLNRDWNKLVKDDSLWKMAFGRLWHKEVQEEEERKKLRRKALMERDYQAKKKKLEEDYERKRRELEEEYDKKRKKLESKKKEESWKQVFEQHYVVQKVRRPSSSSPQRYLHSLRTDVGWVHTRLLCSIGSRVRPGSKRSTSSGPSTVCSSTTRPTSLCAETIRPMAKVKPTHSSLSLSHTPSLSFSLESDYF
jgi:hypothetical protein